MTKVIRIPANIYSRLERHAEGFDTPANVIEKLLNHYEGKARVPTRDVQSVYSTSTRDTTKYRFNGHSYGKGRLVLAVVTQYIADHPDTTLSELQVAFPKGLQGSIGVVNSCEHIEEKYSGKRDKRHYLRPNEIINIPDSEVAVCTQWGSSNIDDFIQRAESLGFSITPTNEESMQNTVEDWQDHIEIVMGFKEGETNIGTPSWTKKIYEDFCKGEASFGATSTNAMEALMLVIKSHDPSKYELALTGLEKTIAYEKDQGKPLAKLTKMFENISGRTLAT